MAILPIVEVPDPRLRQISSPVEKFDDELRVDQDMFETMYEHESGWPRSRWVCPSVSLSSTSRASGRRRRPVRDPRVFITPRSSPHRTESPQGCLSVPDQYAEVERPDRIKARWLDEHGKAHEEEIEGLLAVCLQHEMDHLGRALH